MNMTPERFQHLLRLVGKQLEEMGRPRSKRCVITASDRLMITLRYLATGEKVSDQLLTLSNLSMTLNSANAVVLTTCEILWKRLCPMYIRPPRSQTEWLQTALKFEEQFDFPRCLGALSGIHIQAPGTFNTRDANHPKRITLMGIVDTDLSFLIVDINRYNQDNDGKIFDMSKLGQSLIANKLSFPAAEHITDRIKLPYVLAGYNLHPLRPWLMKPYTSFPGPDNQWKSLKWDSNKSLADPYKIHFNDKLAKITNLTENAFGSLITKWLILRHPMKTNFVMVDNTVKACVCLHNYLIKEEPADVYLPPGYNDYYDEQGDVVQGEWRQSYKVERDITVNVMKGGGNGFHKAAGEIRDRFTMYFGEADQPPPMPIDIAAVEGEAVEQDDASHSSSHDDSPSCSSTSVPPPHHQQPSLTTAGVLTLTNGAYHQENNVPH